MSIKQTLHIHSTAAKPSDLTFSRSTSATRVNNIGQIELIPAGLIRQDFNPAKVGEMMGWLLEESSSNACLQSEVFGTTWITTNAVQTNLASVTANSVKSPDGTVTGDTIAAGSSATGIVAVRQQGFTFTNGTHYTVSVFAKKKDLNFLEISNKDDGAAGMTCSQVFNLSTGATGASGGTVFASGMRAFPNGWYRCEVTFAATANSNGEVFIKTRSDNAVSTTFAATSGQGTYIWGAQVEAKKYATSYIPTTTAAVTRAADVAYVEDTQGKWNWDVGTSILVDATPLNTTEVVSPVYHYQNADNSDYISHMSNGKVAVVHNSTSQLSANPFDTGLTAQTKMENFRSILSIKMNRFHLGQNGSLSPNLPDTSIAVPRNNSASEFTIKFFHGTGLTSGSGWLKQFKIFSTVVSDLDLQNLSFRTNEDAQSLQINAVQVLDGSISDLKLASNSVTNAKVADDAITSAEVLDGSLSGANLAAGAVTATQIAAGTITGTQIAANAITSAHLGVDIILAEDIAANAVTVSELASNAVTKIKISDNSVDIAKLDVTDSGNAGDVLKTNGSGALGFTNPASQAVGGDLSGTVGNAQIAANTVGIAELNVSEGTNGQYLTTNGAGTLSFTSDSTNVTGTAVGGDLTGTVGNAQIAGGAVGTAEIANDAVDVDKLAPNAVVTSNIAAGNVVEASLGNDAVTADKLSDHATIDASRAVGTNHIKDDAVTGDKIAATTITAANIVNGTITGTQIAAGTIASSHIATGTIVEADIADDAVTADKLAANSVVSASIVDGTIVEADLANNAVTSNKINGSAVTGNKLALNAVTTSKIADNQVTIAKLAVTDGTAGQVLTTDGSGVLSFANDSTNVGGTAVGGDVTGTVSNITIPAGSITSAMIGVDVIVAEDIANNAITVAELSDNAVSTAKIQANAVDGTKIAMGSDAAGDILYYDGTDYVRLAKGTSGHVLTQGASAPAWAADSTNVGATSLGGVLGGTVGNASINNNSITGAHLALSGQQSGDTMYYNGTDWVRLAKGTAGQVLTMNGGATAPSWAADSTNVGATAVGGDLTGTVSNASIAANAIDGTHIAIGSDAAGDVMYYDGTNYVRLGKGTDGEVLTLASGVPSWAADSTNVSATSLGGVLGGTVGNATIDANAINGTHIAMTSDARGDILYYDGTNYARLAKGSSGQVLTMGANDPAWAADSTNVGATAVGGMVSGTVSNVTIGAGVVTPTMLSASGTASNTTFLRGDGQWATPVTVEVDPTAVTMAIALG